MLRRKRFLNSTNCHSEVITEKVLNILIIAEYHGITEIKYQIWESGLQDKTTESSIKFEFQVSNKYFFRTSISQMLHEIHLCQKITHCLSEIQI